MALLVVAKLGQSMAPIACQTEPRSLMVMAEFLLHQIGAQIMKCVILHRPVAQVHVRVHHSSAVRHHGRWGLISSHVIPILIVVLHFLSDRKRRHVWRHRMLWLWDVLLGLYLVERLLWFGADGFFLVDFPFLRPAILEPDFDLPFGQI